MQEMQLLGAGSGTKHMPSLGGASSHSGSVAGPPPREMPDTGSPAALPAARRLTRMESAAAAHAGLPVARRLADAVPLPDTPSNHASPLLPGVPVDLPPLQQQQQQQREAAGYAVVQADAGTGPARVPAAPQLASGEACGTAQPTACGRIACAWHSHSTGCCSPLRAAA